ncbi:hypothetical protein [Streptomyces sp. NPDC001410]|uniref:hypothetical protein n=1 Tax=Streptomyces sp. NPDC001410 TaxID=3364574 RepID=UPI00367DDB48
MMPDQGRRTRPWGPLKGPTAETNAVAHLMRQWLDQAGGLRVDDILERLTPEDFDDGRAPGRTTVSERLAGVGLRRDFIHAIARICARDETARLELIDQVRVARQQARLSAEQRAAAQTSAQAQLMFVQQRSIEISDRLLRAMERAAQLERERNDANHMVLVLVSMVDKLQRDMASLTRERDRLRNAAEVKRVREQLARSEAQRSVAEAELEQARAERQRADQLAEEAQERVRVLSEELARLRGEGVPLADADPLPTAKLAEDADDIDVALLKAARVREDRAGRLDQLADELRSDIDPDNSPTSGDGPDNPAGQGAGGAGARLVRELRTLTSQGGSEGAIEGLLRQAGTSLSVAALLSVAAQLRDDGMDQHARQLIFYGIGNVLPADVPALLEGLRRQARDAELYQLLSRIARHWSPQDTIEAVNSLRAAGQDSDAYQVLSAVGRHSPADHVVAVLEQLTVSDGDWVLDAACRNRSSDELKLLEERLAFHARRADAAKIAQTRFQRHAKVAGLEAVPPTRNTIDAGDTPPAGRATADKAEPATPPADVTKASEHEDSWEFEPDTRDGLLSLQPAPSQGRPGADIDPADDWLLNPDTGEYELRLTPTQRRPGADIDPADAWLLNPDTGEYELRLTSTPRKDDKPPPQRRRRRQPRSDT